jgi:hypothetical protein
MELTFGANGRLEINGARITHKNFRGLGSAYNAEGKRNFSLIIPDPEIAEALQNAKNQYGVGWNVKIKAPREEEEDPFMYLPVKVNCNEHGPIVYLNANGRVTQLDEETIGMLDRISIQSVDLNIRPYDDVMAGGRPFRAAYLMSMEVFQNVDRIAARYAEEECPEDEY